jgi:hypothetical protein
MDSISKFKEWVNEHVPFLAVVYENKYVGMAYDRFASLPPKQQRQVMLGVSLGIVAIIVGFILSSYLSLWSYSGRSDKSYQMITMLQQYQKQRRSKSAQISNLGRNSQLATPGAFKQLLIDQAKSASISPRMIQVEEREDTGDREDDPKNGHDVKLKQASVKIQRINLEQLKNFMQAVEFGGYNLSVSSLKITNDDKIRGYMNVDLALVAYLFQTEEGE